MLGAFPEDFGIRAADVVGIQAKRIGQIAFFGETQADLSNTWSKGAGKFLHPLAAILSCGPARNVRQTFRLRRNPINSVGSDLAHTPLEILLRSDYHLLIDHAQLEVASVECPEGLLPASVEECCDITRNASAFLGESLKAR